MASMGHDPFDPEVMKELRKDITHEEVSQITRAMKRPEFQEHFKEYIDEISDPKNKKEYEQYLKQLEDAGEMPKGKVLLRCQPGICVKTSIRFPSGQAQKLFLNICYTDKLGDVQFKKQGAKAHEDPDATAQAPGYAVSLPYSASPPRPDKDKRDNLCMVSDVAVSQRTFVQAIQNEALLKLVVDTVSEAITTSCLKGGETVSRDFKVLQKMRCKGGTPMPMSVSEDMLLTTRLDRSSKNAANKADGMTPAELRKMQKRAKKDQKGKQPVAAASSSEAGDIKESGESSKDCAGGTDSSNGLVLQPKFKIVEVGQLRDLTSFMDSSAGHASAPSVHWTLPEKIRLEVELPGVKHSSDIDVDTAGVTGGVIVQTKRYYLDIALPYIVDSDNATARFDKKLHKLSIIYPVTNRRSRGDGTSDLAVAAPDESCIAVEGSSCPMQGEMESEGVSEVAGSDPESVDGRNNDDDEEVQGTVVESPVDIDSGDTRSEIEAFTVESVDNRSGIVELGFNTESQRSSETVKSDTDFMASDSFGGSRDGYYFGRGDQGLGYYRDQATKGGSELLELGTGESVALYDDGELPGGDGQNIGCELLKESEAAVLDVGSGEPSADAEPTAGVAVVEELGVEAPSTQQTNEDESDPTAALFGQSIRLESSLHWVLL
ncbi:conserved hypothetical protein [Perkinsus marinus ATCC 50983]|uniref:Dynein assembly factor 2, axonemal homolog n=1 Tax=Perkinsus marinus (strain ATCC 50983 / TXsc) TaxID=423536 RepID=C5M0J1_PERM5|nr:conserved hypothetical protein [Perkinsus marinus ATCC 50983]EEQ97526.1 conserved hypothetical protein [Perkinsus marinus ATCC 50983]|eukprot:XP_002764809.1 conserved hypothetical protein [Perkinsus marinus ATCC 50983]